MGDPVQAVLLLSVLLRRFTIIAWRRVPRCHGMAVVSRCAVSMTDLIQRGCFFMPCLLPWPINGAFIAFFLPVDSDKD